MTSSRHKIGLIYAARGFALSSDQLKAFATPILTYKATGSLVVSGVAFAIEWFPRALILPFAGSLIDRFAAKNVFVLTDLLRVILTMIMFLFPQPIIIMLLSGIMSVVNGIAFLSFETFVARSGGGVTRQSILQTIEQIARASGPFLAGFIASVTEVKWCLAIASLGFIISLSLTLMIRPSAAAPITTSKKPLSDLRQSVRILLGSQELLMLTGIAALINLVSGSTLAIMPALVLTELSLPESALGIIHGTGALLTTTLLLAMGSRGKGAERRIAKLGLAIILSGTLLLTMPGSLLTVTLGNAGLAIGGGLWSLYSRTRRANLIPPGDLGKVLGIITMLLFVTLPISGGLVALLGQSLPPRMILAGTIGLALCCGAMLMILSRKVQQRRAGMVGAT
jgi:hypothetical protein